MNRSAILTILVMLATVFAGCLGGDSVDTEDDDSTTNQQTGDGNETVTEGEPTDGGDNVNTPPTANLTASVSTGAAPLAVNFTIAGEDADGDGLTWTLDADGDGTTDGEGDAVPANYEHNFTAAGNYTAQLTISDGTNTTEATLNITVEEAGPPPTVPEDFTRTGTIQVGVQDADGEYQGLGNPVNIPIPVANSTVISSLTTTVTFSAGGVECDIALLDPDGAEVATDAGTITVEDGFVDGDWTLSIRCSTGVRVEYEATIDFE